MGYTYHHILQLVILCFCTASLLTPVCTTPPVREETSTVENDAVETSTVENDAVETSTVENDAGETSTVENDAGETFTVENDTGKPCILLNITFTVNLIMLVNDTNADNITLTKDNVTCVTGSCNDTNAIMNLIFSNDAVWTWMFQSDEGNETLDSVLHFNPSQVFQSNADNETYSLNNTNRLPNLLNPSLSYLCDTSDTYIQHNSNDKKYRGDVIIYAIHVQAFNVENGTFSPAKECDQDEPKPETTSPTTTTSIPAPKIVNTFTVQDDTSACITFQSAISITISYEVNSSTQEAQTSTVRVPEDATSSGSCNFTSLSQSLVLSFFNGWSLQLVFSTSAKEKKVAAGTVGSDIWSYSLSEANLTYVINNETFPNSVLTPGMDKTVSSKRNSSLFKKSAGSGYYACADDTSLTLGDGVKLHFSYLRFKAFNQDKNVGFTGSVDDCSGKKNSGNNTNVIPLAVGAGLGTGIGISLLIIIGFMMVQRRMKLMRRYSMLGAGFHDEQFDMDEEEK